MMYVGMYVVRYLMGRMEVLESDDGRLSRGTEYGLVALSKRARAVIGWLAVCVCGCERVSLLGSSLWLGGRLC